MNSGFGDGGIVFSVGEFLLSVNMMLEGTYAAVQVRGEVSEFKVSQGKWVTFKLKDEDGKTLECFMVAWNLRTEIADGMNVVVRGTPKVAEKWGKFSLTLLQVKPVGEGSIKKSFELLKKKLLAEGLFSDTRKRKLPENIVKIGVISSREAAGYKDFVKILNARWGGLRVTLAHTQVQGEVAADQIIRALKYFNEQGAVDVVAIVRGGGSADDLATFNDERLVREVAASKIPVIAGVGHEVDVTLVDLVADVRASTPSNAAEMLSRDRVAEMKYVRGLVDRVGAVVLQRISQVENELGELVRGAQREVYNRLEIALSEVAWQKKTLGAYNPMDVLKRGYGILRGEVVVGGMVVVEMMDREIEAEIKQIKEKK